MSLSLVVLSLAGLWFFSSRWWMWLVAAGVYAMGFTGIKLDDRVPVSDTEKERVQTYKMSPRTRAQVQALGTEVNRRREAKPKNRGREPRSRLAS